MQNEQIFFENGNMARDSFLGISTMCQSKGDSILNRYSRIVKGTGKLEDYVPTQEKGFPQYVMVGKMFFSQETYQTAPYDKVFELFPVQGETVQLPVYLDTRANSNILVEYNEDGLAVAQEFAHNVMWGFLMEMPVSKLNISVFDCERRGGSILPFLEFRKKAPDIFDGKIYTEREAVYSRLKSYNAEIDERIQTKLGTKYASMTEYNQQNALRGEQMHLLVINDFPCGFTADSINLLINILKNGNKCGIYTVINYNTDISFTGYEKLDSYVGQIKELTNVWEVKNNTCYTSDFKEPLSRGALLSESAAKDFSEGYISRENVAKAEGFSMANILDTNLFARTSESSLLIPMGIGDGGARVELALGKGSSHHVLIAGATGSGKSTLLHTLILSAMLHYNPEELNLYLMDFKSGTEFKIYETCRLPHIKLLALDAMQEFGESILEELVNEMTRRSEKFKDAGATNLGEYVRGTGIAMPRIMVVMDEFQVLFNESQNRKLAHNCAELTKRIVTEGRSYGIHLIMATQSTKVISELSLSAGIIEQMRIRIGLKCGEDDARYLFRENSSKALEMMKGPMGTAVLNPEYTESDNVGFRVAYCDDEYMNHILKGIEEEFYKSEYTMQTFEGKRVKKLLECYDHQESGEDKEAKISVEVGELIKVAPPLKLVFDKKRKHNVIICGAGEKMADNLLNVLMLGVLKNNKSRVYCMDGDILVDEETFMPFYRQYERFEGQFRLAETYGDIGGFVHEIHDAYKQRKKKKDDTTIFVVIRNLQFLELTKRMLKGEFIDESEYMDESDISPNQVTSEDDFFDFGLDSRNTGSQGLAELFLQLVAEGAAYGIHFILSCTEFQTVKENMYYGENVLSKFPERFIFDLNDNDANMLIDSVSVAALGDNTVYYSDGVKTTCQVKPYLFPTAEELEVYLSREPREQTLQSEEMSDAETEKTATMTSREWLRALCGGADTKQGAEKVLQQEVPGELQGDRLCRLAQMYENGWGVEANMALAAQFYKKAAEGGHAVAMFSLSYYYCKGIGVPKDYEKAFYWAEKAAEGGEAAAMLMLAYYYYKGIGVPPDFEKTFYWVEKATEGGEAVAMFTLSHYYRKGIGVPPDFEKAFYWVEKAAENGYTGAMYDVAVCYEQGCGVAKNQKVAEKWFEDAAQAGDERAIQRAVQRFYRTEKAAEGGDEKAMYNLAYYYRKGIGVPQDFEKTVYWSEKAAEAGDEKAMYNLAYYYRKGIGVPQDFEKAFYWIEKAVEAGDVKAMYDLSYYYYKGIGVPQDFEKAFYWTEKAAEAGDVKAMYDLSICYYEGIGVPQDFEKTVYWSEKAAEAGDETAMNNLASCYYEGIGVSQDFEKAVYWFEKAVENGYTGAMYDVAVCYEQGCGVAKNQKVAEKWFEDAAQAGDERAIQRAVQRFVADAPHPYVAHKMLQWCEKVAEMGDVEVMKFLAEYYESPGPDRNVHEATKWYKKATQCSSDV